MRVFHTVRTWSRRTIWGDRVSIDYSRCLKNHAYKTQLFLQFEGPTKLLVQTRASRVNDVLTTEEVNEIANAPPGVTREAVELVGERTTGASGDKPAPSSKPKVETVKQSIATVRGGKVEFQQTETSQ